MGYYVESPKYRAKRVRKAVSKHQAWALASYVFKHIPIRVIAFTNIEHRRDACIPLRAGWRLKYSPSYADT